MVDPFNYISFARLTADEPSPYEVLMERGRLFEYTPKDIQKRLEKLDTVSLLFLQSLPTFICSEISQESSNTTMVVKFGTLDNVRINRTDKAIEATFKTTIDFGAVVFENVHNAKAIFHLDGFQPYRTHWAVRDWSHHEILRELATLCPSTKKDVDSYIIGVPPQHSAPPARRDPAIATINSVESYLEELNKIETRQGHSVFYRGHHDKRFDLTPSLLRKTDGGAWIHMPNEDRLCQEILIAHYDEFQADQYCFDRLVRMQHYGIPTRLLDMTSNPLVALFFACSGPPDKSRDQGEVIIISTHTDNIKYYDADTVSCISNLSKLPHEQKNSIDTALTVVDFNESEPIKKLIHYIQSEKSYFQPRISPEHLSSVICVKAKRTNVRIRSQSGAFLLFGHGASLPDTGTPAIEISRLTVENKPKILSQLGQLNIDETTVYPSIEQTAIHIRERFRIDG